MRIDRLELVNFRGFERLELELHPRLTLLVGVNGSGKSNALEGLAVALGRWLRLLAEPEDAHQRHLERGDVRNESVQVNGVPSLEPRFPTVVRGDALLFDAQTTWSTRLDWGASAPAEETTYLNTERAGQDDDRFDRAPGVSLPVVASYGTQRRWTAYSPASVGGRDAKVGSRLRGYEQCLTAGSSYERLESWMAWRTEVSLQKLAELIKGGGLPKEVPRSPELEAMERAVLGCVEGATRFFYDVNHQELRLELANGELVPFSQLSDGYRNLVAMIADITWRALQLNPHHGADVAREATGVVLIDEIELHLHPAWQRSVIENLLATFPNLQFVATTHSPQIIASARPEHLWLLHEGKAHRPGPIYGKDSNAVLRDIMGVGERPAWMQEQLDRLARLIEDDALPEAKALLAEIEGNLGHDDPTVLGLQWELHDLEVHGAPDPEAEGA
jgi:predicted ATP-binding protein involved in virulence